MFFGQVRSFDDWDRLDFKIIEQVTRNPLISMKTLSQKIEAHINTATYRFQRLIDRNVFVGWTFCLQESSLGQAAFSMLLRFNVVTMQLEFKLRQFCREAGCVAGLNAYSGNWHFEIFMEIENLTKLHEVRSMLALHFGDHLQDTKVLVMNKVLKSEGNLMSYFDNRISTRKSPERHAISSHN
jgi:hypothetical protein